jgi:hypothetical protein
MCIAGINDAGDFALSQILIDFMTPLISLSSVTTTPAIIYQGDIRIYSRIFVKFEMGVQGHGETDL